MNRGRLKKYMAFLEICARLARNKVPEAKKIEAIIQTKPGSDFGEFLSAPYFLADPMPYTF